MFKIGISTAYKISQESKVFKSNTYSSIQSLLEKNLVSKKIIDTKTMYEVNDPSFLLDIINKKRDLLNEIIPNLRVLQKTNLEESQFNTYKGVDAFINILNQLLNKNESIYVYGAPKIAYELLKHRIDIFHQKRISKKIKMYHIYNFEAVDRINVLKKKPFTPIRILPELFDTQVSTTICGNEILFTIWKPPIKVIQIIDVDMAESYLNYFKILWSKAKLSNISK